jgi:nucleoside-diphosphate-sugar epimerase
MLVNLVHLNDVIEAIKTILKQNKWNEIYNVCSGEHPTKHDYYSKASMERSLPLPIFEFSQKVGKKVKSDKIEKDLNFRFSNPI